jgi:hypothetical protein
MRSAEELSLSIITTATHLGSFVVHRNLSKDHPAATRSMPPATTACLRIRFKMKQKSVKKPDKHRRPDNLKPLWLIFNELRQKIICSENIRVGIHYSSHEFSRKWMGLTSLFFAGATCCG